MCGIEQLAVNVWPVFVVGLLTERRAQPIGAACTAEKHYLSVVEMHITFMIKTSFGGRLSNHGAHMF